MGIEIAAKNHLQLPSRMFLLQIIFGNYYRKAPNPLYGLYFLWYSHVISTLFLCTHISSVCTCMLFVCQSYVLVCDPYATLMYSYVVRMSLVCTRMLSVCHSYVFICHPYVTLMYLHVILMSLVCTRMSSLYHSYVLVCHPYVTRMYSYVTRLWFYHESFAKHPKTFFNNVETNFVNTWASIYF